MKKILLLATGLSCALTPGLPELPEAASVQEWEEKRDEAIGLFELCEYGRIPDSPDIEIGYRIVSTDKEAFGGAATRKEMTVVFSDGRREASADLLLYVPNGLAQPAAVFFGLNFGGNHTVCADPDISLPDSLRFENPKYRFSPGQRGSDSLSWNIRETLARGYAVATFFNGDLCEDWIYGPENDLGALLYPDGRDSSSCGFIGINAWGMSRVMDCLAGEKLIDPDKIIVTGCSRNGKIALWAGAMDERFAMVISSSSGSGGASLFRGNTAETIADISRRFPWWMAGNFSRYADREEDFPVDQHQLLAMIAPRPLYVADSDKDIYAVPKDEYASVKAALPAYELYGYDVDYLKVQPETGKAVSGQVGFHTKEGKHSITPEDWRHYYDFADLHFGRPVFAGTGQE